MYLPVALAKSRDQVKVPPRQSLLATSFTSSLLLLVYTFWPRKRHFTNSVIFSSLPQVILTDTSVPPLQFLSQSRSLGTFD